MARERILHITMDDCEKQTFRCGGKGGQNKDKRDTGVRIIHRASGARGESREERTQGQNAKIAWRRMAESKEMQLWIRKMHSAEVVRKDQEIDDLMRPENLLVEYGPF